MNDEYFNTETPEERYLRMKAWVSKMLKPPNAPPTEAAQPAGGKQ